MSRTELINYFFDNILGYKKSYLEIGLCDPNKNYYNVHSANKESVDPFVEQPELYEYEMRNVVTYKMTSDDFFLNYKKTYDLIFIDGLHIASQVVKDIKNSYNSLNPGGYIIIHDCLPVKKEFQDESRPCTTWNGTVWKAIVNLYKAGIDYNTLDINPNSSEPGEEGCCIIKYNGIRDFSLYDATTLDYDEVFSNIKIRNSIMHVISEDEFYNIYKKELKK